MVENPSGSFYSHSQQNVVSIVLINSCHFAVSMGQFRKSLIKKKRTSQRHDNEMVTKSDEFTNFPLPSTERQRIR